jgi:hypothetical protein
MPTSAAHRSGAWVAEAPASRGRDDERATAAESAIAVEVFAAEIGDFTGDSLLPRLRTRIDTLRATPGVGPADPLRPVSISPSAHSTRIDER